MKSEITPEEYESMILACRRRASKLLGYRQMSQAELLRKLMFKGERKDIAENAVLWLTEQGFLDDAQYAIDVVRHYMKKGYNHWRVTQELRRHLVPRDFWDDALAQLEDDETERYYDE
jgi:SOS response regulatory protein OraA/RecX